MVSSLSAQVALLVFAVSIVAGLHAGNSTATILTRALIAMMLGLLTAQFAAWTAKLILRDHLQKRKIQIDQAHVAAVQATQPQPGSDPESAEPNSEDIADSA